MAKKKTETSKSPNQSSDTNVDKKTEQKKEDAQNYDLSNFRELIDLVAKCKNIRNIENHISDHLSKLIKDSKLDNYLILFLYQFSGNIDESTADKIYGAIPQNNEKDILLIINSPGGRIESAYLITKCCKELSPKFVVSIPRKAKSAATLISLGAEEIHMGRMSELGPIDPQFGGLPALGLSSALDRLAKLSTKYPAASEMFASYLAKKLDLGILGYFERVSESAVQYAKILLKNKKLPDKLTIEDVAKRLVYEYKDHSFVIDTDEIKTMLGNHIKTDSAEYSLANNVHNFMEQLNLVTEVIKKQNISIVGSIKDLNISDSKG